MVTTTSSYQDFKITVKKLQSAIQNCISDPHSFFDPETFSFIKFKTSSMETKASLSTSMKNEVMKEGMKATLEAQLGDFLEGGEYHKSTSAEMPNTALTNLISERHFGHLDSSQRRPHSSLHHHSSVILLKQTRKRLQDWYDTLTEEGKDQLWRTAKTESIDVRKKHRTQDRKAVLDSLRLKMREDEQMIADVQEDLRDGQMIAVACQDTWYPAEVKGESTGQDDVTVSFAELGKGLGSFRWPAGKDVHLASRRSVVETRLDVEPRAGGRFWIVLNAKDVQKRFKKYQ